MKKYEKKIKKRKRGEWERLTSLSTTLHQHRNKPTSVEPLFPRRFASLNRTLNFR